MTEPKREPFARVERWEDTDYVVTFPEWNLVRIVYTKREADEFCQKLNAAFNKRLDEEIKKAVVDFRERAAKLMEDPDACPEDIRRLPTEPERGKE